MKPWWSFCLHFIFLPKLNKPTNNFRRRVAFLGSRLGLLPSRNKRRGAVSLRIYEKIWSRPGMLGNWELKHHFVFCWVAYEADPSLAPALADLATPSLSSLRPNQVVTCSTSQLKRIFLRKGYKWLLSVFQYTFNNDFCRKIQKCVEKYSVGDHRTKMDFDGKQPFTFSMFFEGSTSSP